MTKECSAVSCNFENCNVKGYWKDIGIHVKLHNSFVEDSGLEYYSEYSSDDIIADMELIVDILKKNPVSISLYASNRPDGHPITKATCVALHNMSVLSHYLSNMIRIVDNPTFSYPKYPELVDEKMSDHQWNTLSENQK